MIFYLKRVYRFKERGVKIEMVEVDQNKSIKVWVGVYLGVRGCG